MYLSSIILRPFRLQPVFDQLIIFFPIGYWLEKGIIMLQGVQQKLCHNIYCNSCLRIIYNAEKKSSKFSTKWVRQATSQCWPKYWEFLDFFSCTPCSNQNIVQIYAKYINSINADPFIYLYLHCCMYINLYCYLSLIKTYSMYIWSLIKILNV